MIFYGILTVVLLLFGLWNLMIAVLGLFPQFLATAVGTLSHVKTERNVVRGKLKVRVPIATRFRYTYTVKGKEYRYSAEVFQSKRCLMSKTTMVYVKWFPRHAYPAKFKGTTEWVLGICLLLLGAIFGFLVLLGLRNPSIR